MEKVKEKKKVEKKREESIRTELTQDLIPSRDPISTITVKLRASALKETT